MAAGRAMGGGGETGRLFRALPGCAEAEAQRTAKTIASFVVERYLYIFRDAPLKKNSAQTPDALNWSRPALKNLARDNRIFPLNSSSIILKSSIGFERAVEVE